MSDMDNIQLTFFPGSPFARMARILIMEWNLPVTPTQQEFPPTPDLFRANPLGQVPALIMPDGTAVFPTFLVLEHLWEMAGKPTDAYAPQSQRQILMTILQACDALVAAKYQDWTGLGPVRENTIGYDPAERHLERLQKTLDWLESLIPSGELGQGITLPNIALSSTVLWMDVRGGPNWRGRANMEAAVDEIASRSSLTQTAAQPR